MALAVAIETAVEVFADGTPFGDDRTLVHAPPRAVGGRASPSLGSRCSRKNAHIRLVASMLRLVGPTSHSGSGPPPGQECPPPFTV